MLEFSNQENTVSTWVTSAFFAKVFVETDAVSMMAIACDQIREMSGARTVAYIEHKDENGCNPVVVNPERRFDSLIRFYQKEISSRLCPFHHTEGFPFTRESAADDPLAQDVYLALSANNILRFPIRIDKDNLGSILIIDLPDTDFITELRELMEPVCTCLCLALQKENAVALLQSKKLRLESEVAITNKKLSFINQNLRKTIVELEKEKLRVEEANRTKSEFLAIMSHELRTPLNPVIAFSEMLLMEEKDPDKVECLNLINRAGYNLLDLINDLLDYNQLESGKYSIKPEKVDLAGLMRSIVHPYADKTSEQDFRLDIQPGIPPFVNVDPLRLRQIVVNLVSNSIKFTESGEIVVMVKGEGDNYSIIVSDTGSGIPNEHLESVFQPFKQVYSTSNRRPRGSGLGLAIVKNLVNSMRGSISIQSELNKGTCITIKLPVN